MSSPTPTWNTLLLYAVERMRCPTTSGAVIIPDRDTYTDALQDRGDFAKSPPERETTSEAVREEHEALSINRRLLLAVAPVPGLVKIAVVLVLFALATVLRQYLR